MVGTVKMVIWTNGWRLTVDTHETDKFLDAESKASHHDVMSATSRRHTGSQSEEREKPSCGSGKERGGRSVV